MKNARHQFLCEVLLSVNFVISVTARSESATSYRSCLYYVGTPEHWCGDEEIKELRVAGDHSEQIPPSDCEQWIRDLCGGLSSFSFFTINRQ